MLFIKVFISKSTKSLAACKRYSEEYPSGFCMVNPSSGRRSNDPWGVWDVSRKMMLTEWCVNAGEPVLFEKA